jgi:uncharacterized membrane protein YdjX (TVP38/TMEM64 family)
VPRRLIGLLAVAIPALVAAAVLLPHSPEGLRAVLLGLGPLAPAIALAAWVVLVPVMFPGTVLAAAGGLAFGTVVGIVLAVAGAVLGGLAAFGLGRTGARVPVERFVAGRPRLASLHGLLERRGFAAILAARLMPGVPAGGLHYAAGVSPVRARAFAGAIAIGALLRTVPYVVLGQGLGSGSLATMVVAGGSIVLGGLAAAVLLRQLRRAATRPAAAAA